jgi:RNA polymerase sigma factor (sigma-70 family)
MTPVPAQRPRAERAFERLYSRHVADVYRYSLALLRNPTDAEDVTQTTFLNAYRAYRNGDRPDSPRAWLIAIAHNVCRQRFRTAQRRVQEVSYDDTLAEAAVPDPETPTADDIRAGLAHLAFNQRAALVMRELEGRSYAEIATALGVTTSAVETLLFRARRALREQLEGAFGCHEAELAISKQLDGRLSRADRGSLRAHLRECDECATAARRQRAQRTAIRSLGLIPLPSSLLGWGGGTAAAGGASAVAAAGAGGVAMKAAALAAAGSVAAGVGYEVVERVEDRAPSRAAAVAPAVSPPPAAVRATLSPSPAEPLPRATAAADTAAGPGRGAVASTAAPGRRKAAARAAFAGIRGKPIAAKPEKPEKAAKPERARGLGKLRRPAKSRRVAQVAKAEAKRARRAAGPGPANEGQGPPAAKHSARGSGRAKQDAKGGARGRAPAPAAQPEHPGKGGGRKG